MLHPEPTEARRLRLLVSAFAVSPSKGSEYAVGWEWLKALSARHEVWVITKDNEREEIEGYLSENPGVLGHTRFSYITWNSWAANRLVWSLTFSWKYRTWQRKALALAMELDAREHFDAIHHLNAVGFREPGYLWRLPKPFVWGPLGGLCIFPWRFLSVTPPRDAVYFAVKNISALFAMHFARRPRAAARRAAVIISATAGIRNAVERLWGRSSIVESEVVAPDCCFPVLQPRPPGEALQIVWSGSHSPGKALNLLLRAVAMFPPNMNWNLNVLGTGPRTRAWKALAANLGVSHRCHFLGHLPRAAAIEKMSGGHVFVLTSLYDLTSSVLVEALSQALPVICLDHHGFTDVVNDECGIKIPVTTPANVIRGFARAIEDLYRDEARRFALSKAAHRESQKYICQRKKEAIENIYASLCSESDTLPGVRGCALQSVPPLTPTTPSSPPSPQIRSRSHTSDPAIAEP